MDDGESGVTPIIGTILILAITVSGMGVAILVGAPILQRMQDAAALESALAQFEQVRAATGRLSTPDTNVEVGFSMPGGTLGIGSGTRVLVTVYHDDERTSCDLRMRGWEQLTTTLEVSQTFCRIPSDETSIAGTDCRESITVVILGIPTVVPLDVGDLRYCVDAYRLSDLDTEIESEVNLLGTTITTDEPVPTSEDWKFDFVRNDGSVVVEAWLLHTDRLSWTRNGVAAHFELGATLAQTYSGSFLSSQPLIQETDGNLFLRLPMWQGSNSSASSGEGLQTIRATFQDGALLQSSVSAYNVRIDFQGDLAQEWCNSMLIRSDDYTEDPLDLTHNCDPVLLADPDLIRGVLYDPGTFNVVILQQILSGTIEV